VCSLRALFQRAAHDAAETFVSKLAARHRSFKRRSRRQKSTWTRKLRRRKLGPRNIQRWNSWATIFVYSRVSAPWQPGSEFSAGLKNSTAFSRLFALQYLIPFVQRAGKVNSALSATERAGSLAFGEGLAALRRHIAAHAHTAPTPPSYGIASSSSADRERGRMNVIKEHKAAPD
jgi:hypothetical protein